MNKKVVILIVLSLLLAAGIIFIVLNPVQDSEPTEPIAPTGEIVGTAPSAAEGDTQTEPGTAETEETAARTEVSATEAKSEEAKPAETKPEETKPTGPDDYDNTGSNIGASTEPVLTGDSEYEKYMNMSADEQQEYFNSFDDPADFFAWYNKVKQEYEDSRNVIEVGPDATVDLGDIGN